MTGLNTPTIWQVAAGLGVGAFCAALFYGVVRHFGRNAGEGFQTSKLGKEATAIIAVLIILISGGVTITALVLYAPGKKNGMDRSPVPEAAILAKVGWERGTTIILRTWRSQIQRYAEIMAEKLVVPVGSLGKLDAATNDKARGLHSAVFNQLEEEAHQEYLKENADPRTVNPAIREYFKNVEISLPDGTQQRIEEVTKAGRSMHERLFELVRDAILSGRAPLDDEQVNKQFTAYLSRRQAVTEALNRHLAGNR